LTAQFFLVRIGILLTFGPRLTSLTTHSLTAADLPVGGGAAFTLHTTVGILARSGTVLAGALKFLL
jgi:hypothetical protein